MFWGCFSHNTVVFNFQIGVFVLSAVQSGVSMRSGLDRDGWIHRYDGMEMGGLVDT